MEKQEKLRPQEAPRAKFKRGQKVWAVVYDYRRFCYRLVPRVIVGSDVVYDMIAEGDYSRVDRVDESLVFEVRDAGVEAGATVGFSTELTPEEEGN